MITIKIIYVLNIIVAGQIAVSALFNPKNAALTTFGNAIHQRRSLDWSAVFG